MLEISTPMLISTFGILASAIATLFLALRQSYEQRIEEVIRARRESDENYKEMLKEKDVIIKSEREENIKHDVKIEELYRLLFGQEK